MLTKLSTSKEITEMVVPITIIREETTEVITKTTTEVAGTRSIIGITELKTTFEENNKPSNREEITAISVDEEISIHEEMNTNNTIRGKETIILITTDLDISKMIIIGREMTIHVLDHQIALTI